MTFERTFEAWPKIARLNRECVITEKIDGTNGAIVVTEDLEVYAQSRNRLITPDSDNFGFARWVADNSRAIAASLGPGRHFGEWWGAGIGRRYGMTEKRFSLFDTHAWEDEEMFVPGLGCVPVLWSGTFSTRAVEWACASLNRYGSVAAPGFSQPEGVVIYHTAARVSFKVTLEGDSAPKGMPAS